MLSYRFTGLETKLTCQKKRPVSTAQSYLVTLARNKEQQMNRSEMM